MHPLTDEQTHILDLACGGKQNLLLNAYAGCGKTSTLEAIEKAVHAKPILYLVFNKKNAEEAVDRMLSTTTVRTFNSLGHRVWAQACGKTLALDAKKSQTILKDIINSAKKADQGPLWDSYWEVINGVALAKALGYIPEGVYENGKRLISQGEFHSRLDERPDDLTADLIDTVLIRSIRAAYEGKIDYNDQVYMPACFGGTFPQFPLVFVDETQDLNPVNHLILERLCKRSRLIAVGDDAQSIYAFRGAKQGSMGTIASQYQAQAAALSVSFRCPRAIVEHARWRVPEFKWIKDGGEVEQPSKIHSNDITEGSTIISRNNSPLFRVGFKLLASGRSVQIAGNDIGPKLVATMRKLGPEELTQSQTLSAIDNWLGAKLSVESKTALDMADCMKVFAEHGATLGQAIAYAEHLLSQKGTIRLMTGHKSKGLEFDTVYHLDPWLCKATDPQDQNLSYVITTRSQNRLIEINSAGIAW